MTNEEKEFHDLYQKLSVQNKQIYLKSFSDTIAPIESSISSEEKYKLSLFLLKKVLSAKKRCAQA